MQPCGLVRTVLRKVLVKHCPVSEEGLYATAKGECRLPEVLVHHLQVYLTSAFPRTNRNEIAKCINQCAPSSSPSCKGVQRRQTHLQAVLTGGWGGAGCAACSVT